VKNKSLIVALTMILLCLSLNATLAMAQCPRCEGTGEIICPQCDGTGEIIVEEGAPCEHCSGSGTLEPNVIIRSRSTWLSEGKIFVQATYENIETFNAFGRVTAEIEGETNNYKATSPRTLLPANEATQIYLTISGISAADYSTLEAQQRFSTNISIEIEDADCPYCDGTGLGLGILDCPSCGGTGFIECPECGGSGIEGGEQNTELDIGGITYGVAAVVVVAGVIITAFVMVKKRGVKEEDLKRMPLNEFQEWVLKKMEGKASSQSDARMGIDGYTLDGQPVAIKQAEDVGRTVIENFAAAIGRRKAKNGTIVAFSFSTDAIRGRVRAKMSYGFEIRMLTVRELIESRNIPL
jgi:hypothetical protein